MDAKQDAVVVDNPILSGILSINKPDPTEEMLKEKTVKEAEKRSLSTLMDNIDMLNRGSIDIQTMLQKQSASKAAKSTTAAAHKAGNKTGDKKDSKKDSKKDDKKDGKADSSHKENDKYEIVSGKIDSDDTHVILYRKLTPTAVQFDSNGKVLSSGVGSHSGSGK